MKRLGALLLCITTLSTFAFAQTRTLGSYAPKDPESMGMGGVFLSLSEDHHALFGNPAGLASGTSSFFTLMDAWVYLNPGMDTLSAVGTMSAGGDPAASLSALDTLMANGGYGEGANAGICLMGDGLGFAILMSIDSYASGDDAATAKGNYGVLVQTVLGYSVPIDLFGVALSFGGDLRPYYRIEGIMDSSMIADILINKTDPLAALRASPVIAGFGVTLDLGAAIELGDFTVGISVRDITPQFSFGGSGLGTLLDGYPKGAFVVPSSPQTTVMTGPLVSAGVSYRPFAGGDVDPLLIVELQDPVSVIVNGESALALLHAGIECGFFDVLSVRAGINKGWFSCGLGFDLSFFSVDAAFFQESLGIASGNAYRSGLSVEIALTF